MDGKQIKWANFCRLDTECYSCPSYDTCSKWLHFVEKHSRAKGYAHFDQRTSLSDNATRSKVMNPQWVARHGFWPLISYKLKRAKFGKADESKAQLQKKEPRVIRYCAHIDRCIFQRYAFLLSEAYEAHAAETGISDSVIAYRRNPGKSTIDDAKRAFDFIESHSECIIMVSDFQDFFEKVNHRTLKLALCSILNVENLPDDYYAVFKNSTKYSYWSWESLIKLRGLQHCRKARKVMNECETVLDEDTFRSNVKQCVKPNTQGYGIPQGSPISAVFSNIYLSTLDGAVKDIIDEANGLYLRYCDDILVIVPADDSSTASALEAIEKVISLVNLQKGVELQKSKTKLLRSFPDGETHSISEIDSDGKVIKERCNLDYLGFSFDGTSRRLRSRAITKYYYRMRRKAKAVAAQGKGSKNLYGTYSEHSKKIAGKTSFIDYARKASRKMNLRNDTETAALVRHNMEKIAKVVNSQKADR